MQLISTHKSAGQLILSRCKFQKDGESGNTAAILILTQCKLVRGGGEGYLNGLLRFLYQLMAKNCQNVTSILDFLQFFGHKMANMQNFQNRYIIFVEWHAGKLYFKF